MEIEIKKEHQLFSLSHKKLAFYAGSFDPIHEGHLGVVQKALEMVDCVLICPHSYNPNKKLQPIRKRIHLIKIMLLKNKLIGKVYICMPYLLRGVQNNKFLKLSKALESKGFDVSILVGLDALNNNYFNNIRNIKHYVFKRKGAKNNIKKILTNEYKLLPKVSNLSSTYIRKQISKYTGKDYSLSDEINKYITENNIDG